MKTDKRVAQIVNTLSGIVIVISDSLDIYVYVKFYI